MSDCTETRFGNEQCFLTRSTQKCTSGQRTRFSLLRSPQKVLPLWVSRNVSNSSKTVTSDWWASWFLTVLTKSVVWPQFAALSESEVFGPHSKTGKSLFLVFSINPCLVKTVDVWLASVLIWTRKTRKCLKLEIKHGFVVTFCRE